MVLGLKSSDSHFLPLSTKNVEDDLDKVGEPDLFSKLTSNATPHVTYTLRFCKVLNTTVFNSYRKTSPSFTPLVSLGHGDIVLHSLFVAISSHSVQLTDTLSRHLRLGITRSSTPIESLLSRPFQ